MNEQLRQIVQLNVPRTSEVCASTLAPFATQSCTVAKSPFTAAGPSSSVAFAWVRVTFSKSKRINGTRV